MGPLAALRVLNRAVGNDKLEAIAVSQRLTAMCGAKGAKRNSSIVLT